MNRNLLAIGAVAAGLTAFVAVNVIAGAGLRGMRLDLTEGRIYTLAPGALNIARNLKEPIRLTLYFSEKQSNELPSVYKSYGTRVKEVLAEFAAASKGKIDLRIVNPEPFSELEDEAVAAGLGGIPVGRTGGTPERFYFGLVGTGSTDQREVIALFRPDREEFLEYELTHMLFVLSDPKKAAVGLMSWLPVEGGMDPMGRQPQPAWHFTTQLKELFDVRHVAADVPEIPADVRVLLMVHPKNVPDKTLYAVDQFVMRGGRLVVLVDPHCESDTPPGVNPMQAMGIPKNSNLKRLFDAWGFEMVEGKFAGDRAMAIRQPTGQRQEMVDALPLLRIKKAQFNTSDPVTGSLNLMHSGVAGALRRTANAPEGIEFSPLIQTTTDSMLIDVTKIQMMPDFKQLLTEFRPGGERLTLAARVSSKAGVKVKTAFPAGRPPEPPADPSVPPPPAVPDAKFTAESADGLNVIVMADCDFLIDQFWVQAGQRIAELNISIPPQKFADNGDFVIAALDNLCGSSDLINVRARAKTTREFDRVNQLRKDAEQVYLAKAKELEDKLRELEAKIAQLLRQKPETGESQIIATPEQMAEIEKNQNQRVELRRQLRDVQHQLRKDIDRLGTTLKFANIGLMPIVVGLAALGLSAWRVRRRSAGRSAPAARA